MSVQFETAKAKLAELGYELVDESVYETTNTRALIRCIKHEVTWESTIGEAYRKAKYCNMCRSEDGTWQEIAAKKGYTILDESVENVTFQCPNGHEWTTKSDNIRFTQCKICSGQKIPIEEIIEKIISRGFELLNIDEVTSTRCVGSYRCPKGHEWSCYVHNVYSEKSGCPHCSTTSGERKCGFILENIFNKPFNKTRDVVDGGLELDMYNEELRIACEYNGIQHYKEDVKFFHKYGGFEEQKERDAKKAEFCSANGINLIVVPYTIKSFRDTVEFIMAHLNVEVDIDWRAKEIEFNSSDHNKISFTAMNSEIQDMAEAKDGTYLRSVSEGRLFYVFRCSEGHEFKLQPSDAKRGRWCWDCSGRKPLSTESVADKLASVNIELVGQFINSGSMMDIKCSNCESKYSAAWDNLKQREIKNGCCRNCLSSNKKLDKMSERLESLRLRFNEKLYFDAKTTYKWICPNGHEHVGNWNAIKLRKVGCKECNPTKHMLSKRSKNTA